LSFCAIIVNNNDYVVRVIAYADRMDAQVPPQRLAELPDALTHHVGYLSVVMGQRSQALFEAAMEPLGLRPILYDYLAALADSGARSQRALARLLEIDAARVVGLTDELETNGLVQRTVDPADRRRNLISLTRAGRTLFGRASKVASRIEGELLASLTSTDQAALRRLLRAALGLGPAD
jgi:DNA-binding MarR family transcriptional regulator